MPILVFGFGVGVKEAQIQDMIIPIFNMYKIASRHFYSLM